MKRSIWAGGLAVLVALIAGCTGRGGGWLQPDNVFSGQATLGFTFSCERSSVSSNQNPPVGRLRIQLAYSDNGTNPLGGPFGIHGEVDELDPVVESAICVGQNPPPGGNELIFLGRYRATSPSPPLLPVSCAQSASSTAPWCRFEIIVRDNDSNRAPSQGDFFSIKLSASTAQVSYFQPSDVVYARAGTLGGGNIQVD
jgi:hypothetical protein